MSRARQPGATALDRHRPETIQALAVSATDAKNEFGRMLEQVIRGGKVVITRHDTPKAILLSMEEFHALSDVPRKEIEALSGEFDRLLARMQTPADRARMNAAFHATPKELGKAAAAAARKRA